jgi:hypothetical protein
VATFDTRWRLRGHEGFTLGGRAYDTLVFGLSESNNHSTGNGTGRVWYAPALGLFVRKIWRSPGSDAVVGFSVIDVSANGGGKGDSSGESAQ